MNEFVILFGASLFLIGLTIGFAVAVSLCNSRWSDNAYVVQRIYHAGKFYKVFDADKHEDLHLMLIDRM